jgi:hypothetical protein
MDKRKHPLLKIAFLLTFLATIIHIINRIVAATAVLKNTLSPDDGEYYNWRFGNIFYTKQGSGTPLLLIHDLMPISSSAEWESVVNDLSQNHTVYTLDLLGCGRSAKPNLTYTNFLYVQLVTDFVKNVIGHKTNVVASGLSGSFVVMACANDKDTFDKVMLINPVDITSLNQIPTKSSKIIKSLLELPFIGTFVYNVIASRTSIDAMLTEQYFFNPFGISQPMIDSCYEAAHIGGSNGKYLLASILGNYVYFNISHGLRNIENSILIVTGENCDHGNKAVPEYASLKATIKHETIPQTKFLPQQENPTQVLNLINSFIK